ncbi:MAG: hypothetical protein ACI8WB_003028 [Phenylobacterium sp.]|jgi:hypothetical protein
MNKDLAVLLSQIKQKTQRAIDLFSHSVNKLAPYDKNQNYTPDELEPYDALADRFIRVIEMDLRYFRTWELYQEGLTAGSTRDNLLKMEKLGLVTNAALWIDMRNVRNKIVHDYLPEQTEQMFHLLMTDFAKELFYSAEKIEATEIVDQ